MSMRITIQVTCDTPEDAKDAINRLTRPKTWVDEVEKTTSFKDTGSSTHESAEQSGSKNGAIDASRPNINPGSPAIGKMGTKTRDEILEDLKNSDRNPDEYKNGKLSEHLKLMWDRGEIKYDGKEFYL